ncbi:MAG: DNA primase [Candidatus Muirbacterium halophilum]|nr:DNA primase [Candidatus Muirbacterium halophilum]
MISKKSIQEILEKISIIELISNYTELKRSGKNFSGLCPFHEENTPSFYVDEEKKLFHCFGCKKGGNLIQFVQESEALGFVEALEYLSEKFNIPMEYENSKGKIDNYREYYDLLSVVNSIYVSNLWTNQQALKYLKERSISKNVLEKFGVGFSKGDIVDIADKKNLSRELLFKTGIINSIDDNSRENFKDRITIPLKDKYGKIKGYVARTITGNRYKYINSQNSEIYDKAKLLFGFDICRNSIREKDFSIVCEGVFDCMRLYEAGIENSVSVLGTNMSVWQLKELKRISKNIFIMFDSDTAGIEASVELCRKAAEIDINMRICSLPQNTDPDSFIKEHGMSKVMEILKNADFYVDYFINIYMKHTDDVYKKAENFKICSDFINSVSNYFIRNKYSEKVEKFFSMKVKIEKKQDYNGDKADNIKKDKTEEVSKYLKDLLNLSVTYDKVLDIIFKKYYKNIDDLNFKNIILNLHIGKTPAEMLCLEIPDVYKKMLLQYEFLPEKKLLLSDPEAEVVHIFGLMRREKILNEIEKCKKVINNPETVDKYKEYQEKYIDLIKELNNIE